MPTTLANFVAVLVLTAGCTGTIEGGATPDSPPEAPPGRVVEIEGPAVLPHVQEFANASCSATEACTISTYEGHQPTASRALDILVSDAYGERTSDNDLLGDTVADFALAHQSEYAVTYVIFRQRINLGSGWEPMEDRGSITQNHYDHVHVSFEASAP